MHPLHLAHLTPLLYRAAQALYVNDDSGVDQQLSRALTYARKHDIPPAEIATLIRLLPMTLDGQPLQVTPQ